MNSDRLHFPTLGGQMNVSAPLCDGPDAPETIPPSRRQAANCAICTALAGEWQHQIGQIEVLPQPHVVLVRLLRFRRHDVSNSHE
eukprot:scaffold4562_cov255-Pinguiococcus_pyrenoidosus.AAC.16